jgi:hypothetical protein
MDLPPTALDIPAKRPTPPKREELAPLAPDSLIARFAIGVENFDRRVVGLDDSALDTAFLPDAGVGRWPCRVLLGHLADAELAFVHRMRRIVAEDGPVLAAWDEDAFIDAGLYGRPGNSSRFPVGAFIAAIHTLRQWTAQWLSTLDDDAWSRRGLHTQLGPLSLRTVLEYDTWHLEHHAWLLNRKVERLTAAPSLP